MRKYLYLTLDAPDEERIGNVEVYGSPKTTEALKNDPGTTYCRNLETGDTWIETHVGLGYHDFEDEDDYEERAVEVIHSKLQEIDDEHLETAGVTLE